ncbi:MAG: TolC family protein [Deltaproteobacteria bacterium]|nr:MAG: TolC family protein [Deltaproteobacteria bacterium]
MRTLQHEDCSSLGSCLGSAELVWRRRRTILMRTLAVVALLATTVHAQERVGPLMLDQAVGFAIAHHPALQAEASAEEVRREQVSVARADYLPSVDLSLQVNAGTGNVLRGGLYSMKGIPVVSGPPTGRSFNDASLGSLVGVGVSWDAIGLVQKMAEVDAALADEAQARATVQARRLAIAFAAADQFLDVLARAETVRSARAAVERERVFDTIVEALAKQELRPAADASRARAELALAATQLIRAEQAEAVSRTELARALGIAGARIEIAGGNLLAPVAAPAETKAKHPLVIEAEAAERAARARKHAVELTYLPRLDLFASLWVRGSGLTSGTLPPSPAEGIRPDTPNWLTGLSLSLPVLELVTVRARSRIEAAQVQVADARKREVMQAVQAQMDAARQILDAAHKEAANTPIALEAARASESQAISRYRSGLAGVVEVADAQRLLAQAEIEDAVARLNVRRGELLLARAIGDLGPFLDGVRGGR